MTVHEALKEPRQHQCPECEKWHHCKGCQAENSHDLIYCQKCEWNLYGPKE